MPENLKSTAIGAAICIAVFKFVPNVSVKTAAIGVLGIIVAKNVPFLKDAI